MNNKAQIIKLGGDPYVVVDIHDDKEAPSTWAALIGYSATWPVRLDDTNTIELSDFRAIYGSGHVSLIAKITSTAGLQRDAERLTRQFEKVPYQLIIGNDLATSGVIFWPYFREYSQRTDSEGIYRTSVGTFQFVFDRKNAT